VTTADGERRLLRRASRLIALQSAAGVTAVLALTGIAVFTVDQRAAQAHQRSQLRMAVSETDNDVTDPPAGVDLVLRRPGGRVVASTGSPAAAAAAGGLLTRGEGFSGYRNGPANYRVLTERRADGTQIQALLDLRPQDRERDHLLTALLLGGLAGILGATVLVGVLARRAVRPLGDALALQRRFVADASHELRAPLTVLHTRAQVLAHSAGRSEVDRTQLTEQLAGLVADTRALGEVVEDLLIAAELGERLPVSEPVDLGELSRSVVTSFHAHASQSGIDLRLAGAKQTVVAGSAAALRRALSALIDNALGHERPGGRVLVSVTHDADEARLTVADGGVGLDPRSTAGLFDRFARGGNSPGPGRRFGLGLSLVREVAVAHGGQVLVDGAEGQGATFTLVLPVASPSLEVRGGPASRTSRPVSTSSRSCETYSRGGDRDHPRT